MAEIAILCFDDFTDLDVFLPWDLLNRPLTDRLHEGPWRVRLLGDADRHRSRAGLDLPMHGKLEEAATADAVFIASGPRTRALHRDPVFLARLARLDPRRQILAAQCSGTLILAGLGLLRGRRATTYAVPDAIDLLKQAGAEHVEDEGFVRDGRIGTAAGCLAAVPLCAWIIAELGGQALADRVLANVRSNGDQGA